MPKIIKHNFIELNKNPILYVHEKGLTEKQIQSILTYASKSYYGTSKELLSDQSFDALKEYFEDKYPNNPFHKKIGSEVLDSNKVKLPIHMGSMDKKKTEKDINSWIVKYPGEVIISDKLDGISFLLVIENGKTTLLTRGNGTEGKDISKILPYVSIPKLDGNVDMIIRGEMLVSQKNFMKVKDKFSNGRSFIAGLSNFKELNQERIGYLKLVDLVAYELVKPNLKTEDQLKTLKKLGFYVVENKKMKSFNYGKLKDYLLLRKDKSIYDIDGIIITSNQLNTRNKSGNPKYSFAFKMDLEFSTTKVIKVEWNASKHGKLKPLVHIEPVYLCGTKNSKATGNNADFIRKNKIGPGAIVKIIKGGEIIPKIEEVIKGTESQFPDCQYVWNDTKKEIVLVDKENDITKIKKLINFFKTIEVDGLGPGLITKLYQNGYNTIKKICLIKVEQLMELEGIKEKSASKIVSNINKVLQNKIPLEKIVSGSCLLGDGLGEKILVKIFMEFQIKTISDLDKIELVQLKAINGIEEKTAKKILLNIGKVKEFLQENQYLKFAVSQQKNEGLFKDLNIVLTGKRDKEIIEFINSNGGEIKSVVNKNTAFIIVDDLSQSSSKLEMAKKLKVTIYSCQEFKNKYQM